MSRAVEGSNAVASGLPPQPTSPFQPTCRPSFRTCARSRGSLRRAVRPRAGGPRHRPARTARRRRDPGDPQHRHRLDKPFPRTRRHRADVGDLLSHSSIVARDVGIPAVVGTRTATTTIATGDNTHVDGTTGTVTLDPVGPLILRPQLSANAQLRWAFQPHGMVLQSVGTCAPSVAPQAMHGLRPRVPGTTSASRSRFGGTSSAPRLSSGQEDQVCRSDLGPTGVQSHRPTIVPSPVDRRLFTRRHRCHHCLRS